MSFFILTNQKNPFPSHQYDPDVGWLAPISTNKCLLLSYIGLYRRLLTETAKKSTDKGYNFIGAHISKDT